MSSLSSLSPPSLSTVSLQTLSLMPTTGYTMDIEANIKEFWSSFPCPPPWKPRLLIEVNTSRLDPNVSRTLQSFLAGKCDIRHILSGSDTDYNLEPSDLSPDMDFRPTKATGSGSSVADAATSRHHWCDTTCQLASGCAVLVVVVVLLVAVVICTSRHRVKNKMAATRPSRQQLQLSTSTSDAFNCADFSNLEIQGEDELVYPPFRHRGLPHPPLACHPSCTPKWNCPNCASCHPLMRMSPPDIYYSRGYSAVYETIDDEEDDIVHKSTPDHRSHPVHASPALAEPTELNQSCLTCDTSSDTSAVQTSQRSVDEARRDSKTAETGFNGGHVQMDTATTSLPRYFELEHNCALLGHYDDNCVQTFEARTIPEQGSCFAFTVSGRKHSFPLAYQQTMVTTPPLNSCVVDQAQNDCAATAADLQTFRLSIEPSKKNYENTNGEDAQTKPVVPIFFSNRNSQNNLFARDSACSFNDRRRQHIQHTHAGQGPFGHPPFNSHPTSLSTFPDLPNSFFCSGCQPSSNSLLRVHPKRLAPTSLQLATTPTFPGVIAGPDLLKEASSSCRAADTTATTPVNEHSDDNAEVPLRKPVLALHSQYFAKSSLT